MCTVLFRWKNKMVSLKVHFIFCTVVFVLFLQLVDSTPHHKVAADEVVKEETGMLMNKSKRGWGHFFNHKKCKITDLHCRLGLPGVCVLPRNLLKIVKHIKKKTETKRSTTKRGLDININEFCREYGHMFDLFLTVDDMVVVCSWRSQFKNFRHQLFYLDFVFQCKTV